MNVHKAALRNAGDVVAQRYRIEHVLGRGNFAEVHKGVDLALDRPVAIKLMSPRMQHKVGTDAQSVQRELIERFNREAKSVAKLRSVHTVGLYDFGSTRDGILFMIQEFVDGGTLRQLVHRDGQLSYRRVSHIIVQSLKSLREAHSTGLLHRDIKPENIMIFDAIGERDQVRVVDFGIAKAAEEEGADLTATGMLVGTPRYVAPERVQQTEIKPSSDIYSLGGCAYFMMTGHELFEGLDTMDILRAQISPEPIRLPDHVPIPRELRLIFEKMLHKDFNQRYNDAQQIIEELEDFLFVDRVEHDPRFSEESTEFETAPTMVLHAVDTTQPINSFDDDGGATEIMEMPVEIKALSAPQHNTQDGFDLATTVPAIQRPPMNVLRTFDDSSPRQEHISPNADSKSLTPQDVVDVLKQNPTVLIALILGIFTLTMFGVVFGALLVSISS